MLLALLSHFATPQNSVAIRRSLTTKSLEIPDSSTAEKLKLEVWEGIKKPRRRDGVLPIAATLTETDDLREGYKNLFTHSLKSGPAILFFTIVG